VTFLGHLFDPVLTGTVAFGANLALPECDVDGHLEAHPAVYEVKPKPPTPTRTPTPTATLMPTPMSTPPTNGACTLTGIGVFWEGETWREQWKCTPSDPNMAYIRMTLSFGAAVGSNPVEIMMGVCQANDEEDIGTTVKGREYGVNPEDPGRPDHILFTLTFPVACTGGVTIYVDAAPLIGTLVIKAVGFHGTPAPTATRAPNTPTPTVTPSPTPIKLCGDVNDDGRADALDAFLVLQYGAGLLSTLANLASADANHDGLINAIDAAIILQINAALTDSCPAVM
jgi:hypothetical protein